VSIAPRSSFCRQGVLPRLKGSRSSGSRKRDAASSIGEKCKLMEARIEALQALVLVMLVELDLCSLLL
jgi:hypothetical protein